MSKGIKLESLNGQACLRIVDVPEGFECSDLAKIIGCDWIEIVRPQRLKDGLVMIVDEEGKLKGKAVNEIGSYYYGADLHGDPIVGDCLILMEQMGDDGPELATMTDDEAVDAMMSFLKEVVGWRGITWHTDQT